MTQVPCPMCGEKWGIDLLEGTVGEGLFASLEDAFDVFRTRGCGRVFDGRRCGNGVPSLEELAAVHGDDVEAYAAACAAASGDESAPEACPVCGSSTFTELGTLGRRRWLRCRRCGIDLSTAGGEAPSTS